MKKSSLHNLLLVIASTLFALFLLNVLCIAYVTVTGNTPHPGRDIRQQRIKAAAKAGTAFDERTGLEVLADMKTRDPQSVFAGLVKKQTKVDGAPLLPLASRANTPTLLCNECGQWVTYRSDAHGFNNQENLFGKEPAALILGDSFAHGACVAPEDNICGILENNGAACLNLGYNAHGPLRELATLREYAAGTGTKPMVVFWLYYEGNDLRNLAEEMAVPVLREYFDDPSFTQNLVARQDEVDAMVLKAFNRSEPKPMEFNFAGLVKDLMLLRTLRSFLGLDLSLDLFSEPRITEFSLDQFGSVLEEARAESERLGAHFVFVYLPSWKGLFGLWDEKDPEAYREGVLELLETRGIDLIDVRVAMEQDPDPERFFPFRLPGHYNEAGHALVGNLLARYVASTRP